MTHQSLSDTIKLNADMAFPVSSDVRKQSSSSPTDEARTDEPSDTSQDRSASQASDFTPPYSLKTSRSHDQRQSKKKLKKVQQASEIDRFQIAIEINSLSDVEKQQEKLSIIKAHLPLPRLFFLGFLAGWWLGLGVILVVTMSGGIPADVRAAWPMLPKIVTGLLFPVGICFISLIGGELFTGNAMCMLIGLLARRITLRELAYNWLVVLVSNFAGAVFTVYLFSYLTELHATEPWLSYVQGIAVAKVNMKPHVAFLRAIPANALVCTCLLLGLSARDMLGKMVRVSPIILVYAVAD